MISAALSILKTEPQRNELSEFYNTYSDRFYAIAYSKVHNKQDAEDAVVEAFSRIATAPERFFKISAHKRVAYVDVIVRNVAVDMFRKKNKIPMESYDEQAFDVINYISLEDIVIGKISKDELVDFIRSMSESKKDAIILRILYHHSTAEIVHILEISETAARKRL